MKSVIKLVAALVFALIATSANAGDERCHDVYSHTQGDIVMTASAHGGPSGALRVYGAGHKWTLDKESGLWHTKLCVAKARWAEWNLQYRSVGMTMCVMLIGQPDHCKSFHNESQVALTCASQRYYYYPRR